MSLEEIRRLLKSVAPGMSPEVVARNAGAFVANTVGGGLEERICFAHVPKCGGTSVDRAIRRAYRSATCFEGRHMRGLNSDASKKAAEAMGGSIWDIRDPLLAYQLSRPEVRYVYGHYRVPLRVLQSFRDEWSFVTIIRDPVDRWLSHYYFNRNRSEGPWRIERELDDFLETERARGIGTVLVRFFSGGYQLETSGGLSDEAQRRARRTLEAFDVVGDIGNLGDFRERFKERFDVKLDIFHRNKTPVSTRERRQALSDAQMRRIRELCRMDIELYEYAREQMR